jgi:hypothetical protein
MSLFHLEKASVQPFHLLSPMVTNFETALKQLFGKRERYSAYGIYSIDFSFRFRLVKVVLLLYLKIASVCKDIFVHPSVRPTSITFFLHR